MRGGTSNLIVAILTIVTLVALTGFQVTSETSAVRLLGRVGVAMIEIDRWLPAHRDDIELRARDRPTQPLVLTDLPIEVPIPADIALEAPLPVLRAAIQEAMGQKLYNEGAGVITGEDGQNHLGFMEPLRWVVGALERSTHTFWRLVLVIAAVALVAVCAGHFWVRHSPLPGLAVGSAVASILALAVWLIAGFFEGRVAGALDTEIARVVRDSVWLGVRNSVAATAVALGALYAYHSFVGQRSSDWEEWDEYDYDAYEPERRKTPPY